MQVRRRGGGRLKLWNKLKRNEHVVGLQVEKRCSRVIPSGSLGSRSPHVTHATPPGPQRGGTDGGYTSFLRLPRSSFPTRPPHFPCLRSAPACPDPDVRSLSELLPDSSEGRNVREGLASPLLTFHQRHAHTYAGYLMVAYS